MIRRSNKKKAVQLDMPRPWTGNKPFFVRLTAAEVELLKREKVKQNLPSLSAVLEKALGDMLEQVDLRRDGLTVPVVEGQLKSRAYMLSPKTIDTLNTLAKQWGLRVQDILRASLKRLEQKYRTEVRTKE
jgi:hypothetical protein